MDDESNVMETNVQFGGLSFGDQTARLGLSFERSDFNSKAAEHFCVGARLKIVAIAGSRDATSFRQKELLDGGKRVEAEVDCKQYTGATSAFKTGLTFNVSAVDQSALLALRKKAGRILLERIGSCGNEDDEDDDELDPDEREFEAGKDRPVGQPGLAAAARLAFKDDAIDPGKPFPIETLQKDGLKKLAKQQGKPYDGEGLSEIKVGTLKEALEVKTVADLEKIIREDAFWHKKVKRLGETGVDAVTDSLVFFRSLVGQPVSESDAKIDAYKGGCEASLAGGTLEDNPFPDGSVLAVAWSKGFSETAAQDSAADAGTMFAEGVAEEVEVEVETDPEGEASETE